MHRAAVDDPTQARVMARREIGGSGLDGAAQKRLAQIGLSVASICGDCNEMLARTSALTRLKRSR